MSVIYEPNGKAREYSPLACNIYLGCNHGCRYCYAPAIRYTTRDQYLHVEPRRNIVNEFEKDCKKHVRSDKQVLFCFMSDPYNAREQELRLTRECLKIALRNEVPVAILTKSASVLNDIDVFKKFEGKVQVGFTLTFDNDKDNSEWEPGASTPSERIEALKNLHDHGIKTWASFEPVIIPDQSIAMIKKSIHYTDMYKIGKINNFNGIDKTIDWTDFLEKTIEILRGVGKPFYIKRDLRKAAPSVKLYGNEVMPDEFGLSW